MLPAPFLTPLGTPGSAAVRIVPTTTRKHVRGMSLVEYQRVLDGKYAVTPRPAPRSGISGAVAADAADVKPVTRKSKLSSEMGLPPLAPRKPRIVWTAPSASGNPTAQPLFEFKQLDRTTGAYKHYEAYLPKIKQASGIADQVELMSASGAARKLRYAMRRKRAKRKRTIRGRSRKPEVDETVVREFLEQEELPPLYDEPATDVELLTDDESNPDYVDTYDHRSAVFAERRKKRRRLQEMDDRKQEFLRHTCGGWVPSMVV